MINKIKEWMLEIGGAIFIILDLFTTLFSKKNKTLEEEEAELDEREREEELEEKKVGELLARKKEIIKNLSDELKSVTETSQIYASEKIMDMIFGKEGLRELNKKLQNLDEKLMEEKKKDIEEMKEVSGLLKADEEELKKKGVVMNQLHALESKIMMMQDEMEDLFKLFDDRLKEENAILKDKKGFARVEKNSKLTVKHFKELNWIIVHTRKHLGILKHEQIRNIWEKHLMKKIEGINEMSMSMKERKDLVTYLRKNFVNPVRQKLEGEDTTWLERLEMKMMAHEHNTKDVEWESRLEKAVWDLSDEMRKEWLIHKHLDKAFKIIDAEMAKLERMIGYHKNEKLAA